MPYCDGKPRKTLDTCNFLTASRDKTFVSRDESFVPRFREMVVTYFSDLHSTRGRSGCRRLQLQRKQMLKRLSTVRMNWLKRKAVTGTLKVAVVNLKMVKNIKLCMRCSFLKVRLLHFFFLASKVWAQPPAICHCMYMYVATFSQEYGWRNFIFHTFDQISSFLLLQALQL